MELVQITPKKKKALFIKTHGCQMNEYDSQKLIKILEDDYYPVNDAEQAQLILVNTCSVRDKPEQKLYSLLGELRELKQEYPGVMVGVGGCVAQQEGENIVKKSKVVDFVFGTHNLSLVPSLIALRQQGAPPQVAIDYRDDWEVLPLGLPNDGRVVKLVSISRGCNKNCTYCIVPTTRGPEVSRDINEILKEVRIAAHTGAKEIVLLGQTVNSYGLDFKPRLSFVHLLEQVSKIEGVERIRFTSPHPQEIRGDFIELVCTNPKVCRHIHMPLQSGSDRVLKLMNRNYRRAKYLKIISDMKQLVPDMAVSTDIIVGFPGETEADFLESMSMLEEVRFESSFSFAFSPRPGTAAAEMPGQLSKAEKLARLQTFQKRQDEITTEKLNNWLGKDCEVLIDGVSEFNKEAFQGRITQNFVVNLAATSEYKLKPGMTVRAKILEKSRYTLKADVQAIIRS